jgi:hypothetical protein
MADHGGVPRSGALEAMVLQREICGWPAAMLQEATTWATSDMRVAIAPKLI